jgi:TM2 domain-containing membrane protein YozV
MKSSLSPIYILIVFLLVLSGCTMEKRVYRPGYYIEWNSANAKHPDRIKENKDSKTKPTKLSEIEIIQENPLNETASNELNIITENILTPAIPNLSFSTRTGYREKEVMVNLSMEELKSMRKKVKRLKEKKQKLREEEEEKGKSQLVALLLCIFLGGLGIHRFYLGYVGIGIIQLLTAGCCGIWWLIDFIRIATGDLKPKDAEYKEKL